MGEWKELSPPGRGQLLADAFLCVQGQPVDSLEQSRRRLARREQQWEGGFLGGNESLGPLTPSIPHTASHSPTCPLGLFPNTSSQLTRAIGIVQVSPNMAGESVFPVFISLEGSNKAICTGKPKHLRKMAF